MIDGIRGVNSSSAVNRLLDLGLIKEAGRLKTPGRPILLATTDDFLRAFGPSSDKDMPAIDPVKVEEFRAEAYSEAEIEEENEAAAGGQTAADTNGEDAADAGEITV
ncbi:MAG: SMC-Scp complex subunit ScpB [Lachnospiraceae bacterium]|nr:SMC-Scp complex subunit ScpB [Lachnospiraceae bacterium]